MIKEFEPLVVCHDLPHSGVRFWTGEKWTVNIEDAARFHPMENLLENLGFEKPWMHNIFTVNESFYAEVSN